jgi:hypothetical protein
MVWSCCQHSHSRYSVQHPIADGERRVFLLSFALPFFAPLPPVLTDYHLSPDQISSTSSLFSATANRVKLSSTLCSGALPLCPSFRPDLHSHIALHSAVKVRTHVLYSDTSYNSPTTAYSNVYRGMIVVALKFQAYVQEWGVDAKKSTAYLLSPSDLVISCSNFRLTTLHAESIRQIVAFSHAALVHRAHARKARLLKVEFTMKRQWVMWCVFSPSSLFHALLTDPPLLLGWDTTPSFASSHAARPSTPSSFTRWRRRSAAIGLLFRGKSSPESFRASRRPSQTRRMRRER